MKGYYVHFEGRSSIGISKKIDMQMIEFKNHFDMDEVEVEVIPRNILQRIIGLFPTVSIARNYDDAFEKIIDPDFIYVRRTTCDRSYLLFWKRIKEKYPNCKIIIEIFTYPYDKDDFGKWDAWPFLIKEWIYRGRLKKYVDRFVTYTDDEQVFGIPVISAANGIVVDTVRQVTGSYKENKLRILGVAFLQRQHGYERLITGLHQYYERCSHGDDKPYEVFFDIVGDGPEKEYYIKLVEKYQLQNYVRFHPKTVGEELESMYENADMAAVAFGMYKVGVYSKISALKSREYLAKGISMVSGCGIDVISDDYPFVYFAPNDATPIEVSDLIDSFNRIKEIGTKEENASVIRKFAIDNVSMNKALAPIISYIKLDYFI